MIFFYFFLSLLLCFFIMVYIPNSYFYLLFFLRKMLMDINQLNNTFKDKIHYKIQKKNRKKSIVSDYYIVITIFLKVHYNIIIKNVSSVG
jgi:hypothetical protein